MENMLGLFRCGHYNEVALLLRWPLSEVSLYQFYNFCKGLFKDLNMQCSVMRVMHESSLYIIHYSNSVYWDHKG